MEDAMRPIIGNIRNYWRQIWGSDVVEAVVKMQARMLEHPSYNWTNLLVSMPMLRTMTIVAKAKNMALLLLHYPNTPEELAKFPSRWNAVQLSLDIQAVMPLEKLAAPACPIGEVDTTILFAKPWLHLGFNEGLLIGETSSDTDTTEADAQLRYDGKYNDDRLLYKTMATESSGSYIHSDDLDDLTPCRGYGPAARRFDTQILSLEHIALYPSTRYIEGIFNHTFDPNWWPDGHPPKYQYVTIKYADVDVLKRVKPDDDALNNSADDPDTVWEVIMDRGIEANLYESYYKFIEYVLPLTDDEAVFKMNQPNGSNAMRERYMYEYLDSVYNRAVMSKFKEDWREMGGKNTDNDRVWVKGGDLEEESNGSEPAE